MDGLLYVDKPAGITSHDVVAVVRRAARSRRVGHAGTLDPFATGLLVLGLGQCTRLLPFVQGEPKVYDAVVRFGAETDTDDATGQVVQEAPLPPLQTAPGRALLLEAMSRLTGRLSQVPPSYSAKHVDGQRAYSLARRGLAVDLPAVDVVVHGWELLDVSDTEVRARITCAGGTYVRALARDLGRALHSAAHCLSLRRLASGTARVDDATPLAALLPGAIADGDVPLRSALPALGEIATEALNEGAVRDLAHGRAIRATNAGPRVAFVREPDALALAASTDQPRSGDLQVLGIGDRIAGDRWQPRVVLLGGEP